MIDHRTAAASDVGRVRNDNEDSFLRGDAVFAVADGMGGHVAGEIASRTALEPLAQLDGRVFPDGPSAVEALRQAVIDANGTVAEKARFEPGYRGMGTTLTAAMIEGRRLHLAHVGDSRAYLLRDGTLEQITTDHTLVQHLIDEGQITTEEASAHPQRSIITRAIGVGLEISVDTLTLDIQPGDQILLCSDGLTGVVLDRVIEATLAEEPDPQRAVDRLVAQANASGGPDNITIVLLRFAPKGEFAPIPEAGGDGDGRASTPSAAASTGGTDGSGAGSTRSRAPAPIHSGSAASSDGWAEKLGRLGAGGPDDGDDGPYGRPSPGRRILAGVVVLALLLAVAGAGGRWLLGRSYYVGAAGEQVAIYQGIPTTIGPVELHWVEEVTDLELAELPRFLADDVQAGRAAASLADARNIVRNLRATTERDGVTPPPSPSPTPSPTRSAAAALSLVSNPGS